MIAAADIGDRGDALCIASPTTREGRARCRTTARNTLCGALLVLSTTNQAQAASYFCTTEPIRLGSYRPDSTNDELDIRVKVKLDPFWFDDATGDYQSLTGAVAGQVELAKLPVPLGPRSFRGSLPDLVWALFQMGRCTPSEMGALPPSNESKP